MKTRFALTLFLFTFLIRGLFIHLTPSQNQFIDLKIYRDAGELILNGINPYDFSDNLTLRNQLRTDSLNYEPFVSESQSRWDYYSSSNLPLANTLFGIIEKYFNSALAYRIIFAIGDSMAVVLIVLILTKIINRDKLNSNLVLGFLSIPIVVFGAILIALSPYFILWGVLLPGPKGIGLFFILSSIYFSLSDRKFFWLFLAPVFLAFSVNFIGLGLFIAPLSFNLLLKKAKNKFDVFFFILVGVIITFISLLPFIPEIFGMMSNRASPKDIPQHASMWVGVFDFFPSYWKLIKYSFITIFTYVNTLGFLKRKIDFSIVSASLMLLFTVVYLDSGSMDRINIAIVTSLLLILISGYYNFFLVNSILYLIFGSTSLLYSVYSGVNENLDAIFCLIFVGFYFLLICIITFKSLFKTTPKFFERQIPNFLENFGRH